MSDSPTSEELFASVEKLINGLRLSLVDGISPEGSRPGAKLVRLSVLWREAMRHRVIDLASAARAMFDEGRLIPGCTLTRSLFETVAMLHYLNKKLASAIETEELEDVHDVIVRGTWGSKDESTEQKAIQVLTALDHLDKELGFANEEYFHLCEYAHPNMKGGIGTYSQIDISSGKVELGINPQGLDMGTFGLGSLEIILTIAEDVFSKLDAAEEPFRDVVYRVAPGIYVD